MAKAAPHIVCFAPYTDWSIHSARQVTLLHALGLRGTTSTYVTCDAVFSDCDLFQQATGAAQGRQENSCLICQASVASRLAAWSMPYHWLGTWLTTQDRTDIGRWLAELSPSEYPTAQLKGWDIRSWVQSSVRTHLRCNTMDLTDKATAATYASYLYSGGLAALGLDRLFDEEKPDIQSLFNGRMAPTRIALELALQKGICTLVEERAAVAGRLMLFDNVNCLDMSHVDRMWEAWNGVPLSADEIEAIAAVLDDRRSGGKGEVSVFSQGRQAEADVRSRLSLDAGKPVWVLFTSSVDEIADKAGVKSIFPSQQEWIDASMAYAAANPGIQLVVRVHPNVGGHKALGENAEDMAYFKALAGTAPKSVRIVQPGDDISSYTLAEMCDLALVWYSTIAIETAALGRRVVRAGGFLLEGRAFISAPDSPDAYPALLDSMQTSPPSETLVDIAVAAWRFAYIWFLRRSIPFPQVAQPEWYIGEPAWQSADDLKPGSDPNLDRICDVFLNGAEIHPPPPAGAGAEGSAERDAITAERDAIAAHIHSFLPERTAS